MIRIFAYKNCDSCRKAIKWLRAEGIEYEEIAIRERPPSKRDLQEMLKHRKGVLKSLFNTSGKDYRELGLKDRINQMEFEEAAELLSGNGNLVKRPFVLGEGFGLLGFKEGEWSETFGR
ncbi:MAG: arsenate reductase family protein [Haloferula sp.]